MLNAIRTTAKTMALSAVIGLGALAAVPAVAQADGVYLNFGGRDDGRVGVYEGDRDGGVRHVHRDREWERDGRRDRYRDRRGYCSDGRAIDKAQRMGLRRARIVGASPRTVRVSGFKYGTRVTVVFANQWGCPIVYR